MVSDVDYLGTSCLSISRPPVFRCFCTDERAENFSLLGRRDDEQHDGVYCYPVPALSKVILAAAGALLNFFKDKLSSKLSEHRARVTLIWAESRQQVRYDKLNELFVIYCAHSLLNSLFARHLSVTFTTRVFRLSCRLCLVQQHGKRG